MIGNDVVDLACDATRPGARHPRFDARVYSDAERRTLAGSTSPDLRRWLLWAAKESAYKLARRMDPDVVWSPRRFGVHLDDRLRGSVHWPGGGCRVRVDHGGGRVHALAARSEAELDAARFRVARTSEGSDDPDSASAAVRRLVVRDLAAPLGLEPSALVVHRRGRIPELHARGGALRWPLSLSHHGRFVAYAALPAESAG